MEVMGHGIEWVRFVVSGSVPDAAFLSSAISNTPFISSQKCEVKGDLWIIIMNNTAWCERSKPALFDYGAGKAAFNVYRLLLPQEVFQKRILAKCHSLQRCGLSMRKGAPNNAVGKDIFTLYTLSHATFYSKAIKMRRLQARCESKLKVKHTTA